MMNSYRDLKVYEKSYRAAKAIYMKVAAEIPYEERYGLKSQIQRAAVSIPLNIAEGYGKGESKKELLRYMYMARGSANEVTVLLDFARDFGYISEEIYKSAKETYEEIGRMLTGFIQNTRK